MWTYTGDTPHHVREQIVDSGQLIVTNPDTVHATIMRKHSEHARIWANLRSDMRTQQQYAQYV